MTAPGPAPRKHVGWSRRTLVLSAVPVLILAAVAGWVFLGGLPGVALGADTLAWMMELPVYALYLALAVGAAWSVKVTYLHDISPVDEARLFELALEGDRAARWLLIFDRLQWVYLLALFCLFLWPAR